MAISRSQMAQQVMNPPQKKKWSKKRKHAKKLIRKK